MSWKKQIRTDVALLGGLGVAHHAWVSGDPSPAGDYQGLSLNADFGAVKARRLSVGLDGYTGAMFAAAVPIRTYQMETPRDVIGLSLAAGIETHPSSNLRLFLEAGPRVTGIYHEGLTFGLTGVAGLALLL